jgi:hypothetical protein
MKCVGFASVLFMGWMLIPTSASEPLNEQQLIVGFDPTAPPPAKAIVPQTKGRKP